MRPPRGRHSAPGIGEVTAASLVTRLPELGHVSRSAIANLAGLAPHACDLGLMRGQRLQDAGKVGYAVHGGWQGEGGKPCGMNRAHPERRRRMTWPET